MFWFDEREVAHPYLIEAVPQLNTDSWRVFPDGRMETTYRLRPNLTWHDGTPHTADDFVFAWRVYATPSLTWFRPLPQRYIDEVVAVDARTVVIRWNTPYAEAASISTGDFPPLPRHILEGPFQQLGQSGVEGFQSHPFWTREYVGLGPYALERWEPGAFIEAGAFDRHVLGAPKIRRVQVLFISDPNTVLANLLAGAAHIAVDDSIDFQQGLILKREWAASNGGAVLLAPDTLRYVQIQHTPQFMTSPVLRDLRVRKALAHTIDKQALNEGMYDGQSIVADAMTSPLWPYAAEVDRVVTKYPYDPRRAEQLMAEAGFTKTPGGFYTSPAEGRFSPEVRAVAGAREERELTILVDSWRNAGVDAVPFLLSLAQTRDNEFVAKFPSLYTARASFTSEDTIVSKLSFVKAPTAENRWQGSGRGGWFNPEYERLYEVFNTSLDRAERNQAVVQMMKLATEDVANFPLYYTLNATAHVAALRGPRQGLGAWNIHEWEWQ